MELVTANTKFFQCDCEGTPTGKIRGPPNPDATGSIADKQNLLQKSSSLAIDFSGFPKTPDCYGNGIEHLVQDLASHLDEQIV